MNEHLRERIVRRLESLSDERGYQVLDYVEFLESRYAERSAPGQSVFAKFAETVEDTMRAGKLSASTIGETMGFLNRAMGVLNGVAAAGKTVATDIVDVARTATGGAPAAPGSGSPAGGTGSAGSAGTPPASSGGAAPDSTARPGSTQPPTPPVSGEPLP